MFFALFAEANSKLKAKFVQKLSEKSAARSIFGHSMAYSPKMDALFVGAEYFNVTQEGQSTPTKYMGAVYAYKYSTDAGDYKLIQTILPPSDQAIEDFVTKEHDKQYVIEHGWPEIRQMGSFMTVTEDGTRLIVGCPYSNTYRQLETTRKQLQKEAATPVTKTVSLCTAGSCEDVVFEQLQEVGAALVYEYDSASQKWIYKSFFIPQPADMKASNGLGRVGGISPSGNTLCLTYFNKKLAKRDTQGEVFTASYNKNTKTWSELTAAPLDPTLKTEFETNYKFIGYGSSVQFLSETTMMIGVQVLSGITKVLGSDPFPGTQVFVYKDGKWAWDHQFVAIDPAAVTGWSDFGYTIQLAGTGSSQVLVTDLALDDGTQKMVILKNVNNDFSAKDSSMFSFGEDFNGFDFYQGSANLFVSTAMLANISSDQAEKNGAIRVYELNDDKQYTKVLDLIPPEADRKLVMLNFGCSVQWKDETHVFIGAHHKEPGMGLPLDDPAVYFIELQKDNSKRNGIIIGCVVAAVVVIVVIVIVVVCVRRKKSNESVSI